MGSLASSLVAVAVAVAVAGAGCGGDDDDDVQVPPDTAQSGSRLKLSWFEIDGGLRTWTTEIFDRQLGVACAPSEWTDGVERCTPQLPWIFYADAACTQPIILGTEAAYGLELVTACSQTKPARMFASIGEVVNLPVVYGGVDDCSEIPSPQGIGFAVRRAVALPQPDAVALRRVYQGQGRLRIETLTSADGLLLPVQPYDLMYDAACRNLDGARLNTDGLAGVTEIPCSLDATETSMFADLACETPGILMREAMCEPPAIAVVFDEGPCVAYHAVGDSPQSAVFQSFDGTCRQLDEIPGADLYAAVAELEPLRLERAARSGGAGRLQLVDLGLGDVRIRDRVQLHDTELGTDCELRPVDIDRWECLPMRSHSIQRMYTDAACTQPVSVALANAQGDSLWPCIDRVPPRYAWDGRTELRLLGALHTAPLYQQQDGFPCVQVQLVDTIAYSLGAPITTTFPAARKVRD